MDGCRYRLFVAGSEEEGAGSIDESELVRQSFSPDAFASWVSPEIVLWGDSNRRSRRRHMGGPR